MGLIKPKKMTTIKATIYCPVVNLQGDLVCVNVWDCEDNSALTVNVKRGMAVPQPQATFRHCRCTYIRVSALGSIRTLTYVHKYHRRDVINGARIKISSAKDFLRNQPGTLLWKRSCDLRPNCLWCSDSEAVARVNRSWFTRDQIWHKIEKWQTLFQKQLI